MRWLHLSDLHVRSPESESMRHALNSLADDVQEIAGEELLDAIIVSGDLAFKGTADEYKWLGDWFSRLRGTRALVDAKLFCVPGNHDRDCDRQSALSWDMGSARQSRFFDKKLGKKLREERVPSFQAYNSFGIKHGAIPFDAVDASTTHRVGDQTSVVLLNTCFFSDVEVPDEHRCPALTHRLREEFARVEHSDRVIVVGHYPIEWFEQLSAKQFRAVLGDRQAIYVHGHLHHISSSFTARGLESLGLGSGFQASLDYCDPDRYTNKYALCEWADDLVHVKVRHFDPDNSRWRDFVDTPHEWQEKSSVFLNGFALKAPSSKPVRPHVGLHSASKISSRWFGSPPTEADAIALMNLLCELEVGAEPYTFIQSAPGWVVFQTTSKRRYVLISSGGTVLTKTEIHSLLVEQESEEGSGTKVVTFGTLADDGATALGRLAHRNISVMHGEDLVRRLIGLFSPEVRERTRGASAAGLVVTTGPAFFVVLPADNAEAFGTVLDAKGSNVEDVSIAKAVLPSIRTTTADCHGNTAFDRSRYLRACADEFNQVNYAALNMFGFRVEGVTLDSLYLETEAATELPTHEEDAFARAVEELLDGSQFPPDLRSQLASQIRKVATSEGSGETRSASAMYRKHGTLILSGEPGSGKTCFVKTQIVAYARATGESWHSRHVPIYVPLVELNARETAISVEDLLAFASEANKRRGLDISQAEVGEQVKLGTAALFFDGLDEISSPERRSQVFDSIATLIKASRDSGSRVVLTTRPAALNLVSRPPDVPVLALQGLADLEIRALAERVVSSRASSEGITVPIGPGVPNKLVDRFMDDCRLRPGLHRLARNPLLLTLLITIYANGGAAAARRHKVYSQAVSTLVGARAREKGQRQFSESDVRAVLGPLSLEVFQNPSQSLPSLDRAVELAVARVGSEGVAGGQWLHELSNATGLITLHRPDGLPGSVSFMHYSFMEYYAALELAAQPTIEISDAFAVDVSRWKEIVQLCAGITSERGDVCELVRAAIRGTNGAVDSTLRRFELAARCALESEVPPAAAQRLLANELRTHLAGSLRLDAALRTRLASALGDLYDTSSVELDDVFIDAMLVPDVSAAAIHLVGKLAESRSLSQHLLGKLGSHTVLAVGAMCEATPALLREGQPVGSWRQSFLQGCLSAVRTKNTNLQLSALRAAQLSKDVYGHVKSEAIALLSSSIASVALRAAIAILTWETPAALDAARLRGRATRIVVRYGRDHEVEQLDLGVTRATVQTLAASPEHDDQLDAVALLGWVSDGLEFARDGVLRVLALPSGQHQFLVMALEAVRASRRLRETLRVSDVDSILRLLDSSPTHSRDVRIAALRAIGSLVRERRHITRRLVEHCRRTGLEVAERRAALQALSTVGRDDSEAHEYVLNQIDQILNEDGEMKGGQRPARVSELVALLHAASMMESKPSPKLITRLQVLSDSYKTTRQLRNAACFAIGALATPTSAVVVWMCSSFPKFPAEGLYAAASSLSALTGRAKKQFDWLRAIEPHVGKLRILVDQIHEKAGSTSGGRAGRVFQCVGSVHADLDEIRVSYDEMAPKLPG